MAGGFLSMRVLIVGPLSQWFVHVSQYEPPVSCARFQPEPRSRRLPQRTSPGICPYELL